MSKVLRYGVSEQDKLVTVREELEQLKNYTDLLHYCLPALQIFVFVDDQIMDYSIIKVILQPLVENAVSHGLEGKLGHGTVRIIVENSDRTFFLRVRDDGVGMPDEQVERLNAQFGGVGGADMTQPCGGIALRNVNSRIRLMFGEDYGLHLFSAAGVGTECCVTLPLRFREA